MLYGRSFDGNRELGRGGRVGDHRVVAELRHCQRDGLIHRLGLDMGRVGDSVSILEGHAATCGGHAADYIQDYSLDEGCGGGVE